MNYPPTIDVYTSQGTVNKINGVDESNDWSSEYGVCRVVNPASGAGISDSYNVTPEGFSFMDTDNTWNGPIFSGVGEHYHMRFHWVADAEI